MTIFRYGNVLTVSIILLNLFHLIIQEETVNTGILLAVTISGFGIFFLFFHLSGKKNFKEWFSPFVSLLMMTLGGIILVQITVAGMGAFRSTGYLIMVMIIFICYSIPRFPCRWSLATSMMITVWYLVAASFAVEGEGGFLDAIRYASYKYGWLLFLVHVTGIFVAKTRDNLFTRDSTQYNELVSAHKKLRFSYDTIQEDLQLAKEIQRNILPPENIELPGLDIKAHYLPFREVSGDFYDIYRTGPDQVRIFLADATGHGIQAALITMIIKSEYEALKRERITPSELLMKLNKSFISSFESLQNYFSCICLDIDFRGKELLWSSAGHLDQILVQGKNLLPLSATGILAGDTYESEYGLQRYRFERGDKLFLFTDGLYERMNEEVEDLVKEVIQRGVEEKSNYMAGDIFHSILDALEQFYRDHDIDAHHDDITLIAVERTDQE